MKMKRRRREENISSPIVSVDGGDAREFKIVYFEIEHSNNEQKKKQERTKATQNNNQGRRGENNMYIYLKYIYAIVIVTIEHVQTYRGPMTNRKKEEKKRRSRSQ